MASKLRRGGRKPLRDVTTRETDYVFGNLAIESMVTGALQLSGDLQPGDTLTLTPMFASQELGAEDGRGPLTGIKATVTRRTDHLAPDPETHEEEE